MKTTGKTNICKSQHTEVPWKGSSLQVVRIALVAIVTTTTTTAIRAADQCTEAPSQNTRISNTLVARRKNRRTSTRITEETSHRSRAGLTDIPADIQVRSNLTQIMDTRTGACMGKSTCIILSQARDMITVNLITDRTRALIKPSTRARIRKSILLGKESLARHFVDEKTSKNENKHLSRVFTHSTPR